MDMDTSIDLEEEDSCHNDHVRSPSVPLCPDLTIHQERSHGDI